MRRSLLSLSILTLGLILSASVLAGAESASKTPVKVIAPARLHFSTAHGSGVLPLYVSADWSKPLPGITRAIVIFHGILRNADVYNASGLKAIHNAGKAGQSTLLITPQFLSPADVEAFHLPADVLYFPADGWQAGDNAVNAPISSYDAMDAILDRLADRKLFPNLKVVVVAGHSGGGQVVQRYAVVGRGGDTLVAAGVHVHYVVANPSSYAYFSPLRPVLDPKGTFTFAVPRKSCYGKYNNWKYGILDVPPYLDSASFPEMEQRYVHRDVTYLLGLDDTDPNHPALDKSCSGEDEGPYRLFRGKAYFAYMIGRHPGLASPSASQKLWFVPGVGHDADKMFNSPCGLAALFDSGVCTTHTLDPKP